MKCFGIGATGIVWMLSGLFLMLYGGLGLLSFTIPGLQELASFIEDMSGMHLYTAAFLSIFFEGLYLVGNFIPGSTLVLLLAVLAQTGGPLSFIVTIFAIFCGWSLSGFINIFFTSKIVGHTSKLDLNQLRVQDRLLTTWYPAFRANYEVAQVVSGIPIKKVFWSSLKVKFFASIGAAVYALLIPFFIDVNNMNNQEGFVIVFIIGIMCIGIGVWDCKKK